MWWSVAIITLCPIGGWLFTKAVYRAGYANGHDVRGRKVLSPFINTRPDAWQEWWETE